MGLQAAGIPAAEEGPAIRFGENWLAGKRPTEKLIRLGVNLKFFPSSPLPAAFSILFHAGIAAVLLLYGLFWLKLDLFTALKALCFLGPFLVFVGHRTLSYLASTSAKLKSS